MGKPEYTEKPNEEEQRKLDDEGRRLEIEYQELVGPQPNSARTQNTYAPLTSDSWYNRTGGGGVIVRYADRNGIQFSSQ